MLVTPSAPKYRRIAEALRQRVRSGQLPPGSQLPSYRELAQQHGVTIVTVRQAMQLLQREGAIETRPRVGCVVARPRQTWRMMGVLEVGRGATAERLMARIKEIHDQLQTQRCHVTMRFVDRLEAGDHASLKDWAGRLDALLLDGRVSVALLREVAALSVPVIMIGEPTDGPCPSEISSVSIDIAGTMRLAVSHLTSLGHRRIAFYTHRGTRYFEELNRAFHRCMAEQGLAERAVEWQLSELPYQDASIPRMLDAMAAPPTALIVEEITRANTIVNVLGEHGWPVPERVSVLALTAGPDATGLTRINSPWNEMIARAATLADQVVRSPVPTSRSEKLIPVFVPGKTCRSLNHPSSTG